MTPEEQAKLRNDEINHMFNCAEKCVMEYISEYLSMKPEEIFCEVSGMEYQHPVYVKPVDTYDPEKVIKLSISIVDNDFVSTIPVEILENHEVQARIGFIHHSIMLVYQSILASNIKEEAKSLIGTSSFHLELDDEKLAFFPVYIYPQRRAEILSKYAREQITEQLSTGSFSVEEKEVLIKQLNDVNNKLSNIVYDKNEADKNEEECNSYLKLKKRIGISVEFVNKNTLN